MHRSLNRTGTPTSADEASTATITDRAVVHHVRGGPAPGRRGPSLRAVPFRKGAVAGTVDLLSESQRQQLADLATVQQLPARSTVYRAGASADAVFIIGEGAIKSFRDLPSGRRRIAAFLFGGDLFGLAEAGQYVNTVQAMTPLTIYRLDVTALARAFERDSGLELQFLCKTIHTLREAQHHTIIVGRRHATGRLAMLLRLLERQSPDGRPQSDLTIPMSRSDMANYLGLSLEAVIRASRRLEQQGIVDFVGRHHARIVDRQRFNALASAL